MRLIALVAALASAAAAPFAGRFFSGEGDGDAVEWLQALDTARGQLQPSPILQDVTQLYLAEWNGFVEGPTWGAWWTQNSYGTSLAALPFLPEPQRSFIRNANFMWFEWEGNGTRVGLDDPHPAPDGCLCDAAMPTGAYYKQGDGNVPIHDWALEETLSGVIMQAEQLLVERDAAAAADVYLPLFNRTLNLIESRREPALDLFFSGDASNLLAPSYGAWLLDNGTRLPAFLTGMSVSYVAALDRVIELELLVSAAYPLSPWAAAAALHGQRRASALTGLARLLEPAGRYFVKSLDPNGTMHGVLGQARHGYIEAVSNHDAVALGVAERVQPGLDEKIMASLLGDGVPANPKTGGPGLRPFGLVITNAGGLDDMEYDDSSWLWSFGTWVNGGEWATCEARMMLAYFRTGRLDFALDSWRALMGFASIFRMDSPLVEWGSAVYQPNDPINIVYDMFAIGAALIRGIWSPVYSATQLVLTPHVPGNVSRINSTVPLLFGRNRIFVSAAGNSSAPISCVTLQGVGAAAAWPQFDALSVTLPYDALDVRTDNFSVVIFFGGSGACPAPEEGLLAPASAPPAPAAVSATPAPLHAQSRAAAARALRAIAPQDALLWFDASTLTLADGERVAAWPDARGAGAGASQAAPTLQPVFRKAAMNGLPAVDFDGNATFLDGAVALPPQSTIVAVFSDRGTQNLCCTGIFYSAPGCAGMGTKTDGNGGTAMMIDWSGSGDTGQDDITGRQVVGAVLYNGSGGFSFADGCAQSVDAGVVIPAPGGTSFMVGSRGDEDARFFNGTISEMLVFARALNDTERGNVEAYLSTKWPRAGKPLSCSPQPPNCTLPPALAASSARLGRFVDAMRSVGRFADSMYELAHALLALDSLAAWQARCAGLNDGSIAPLASAASEKAADASYVSSATNLAAGLAAALEAYAGSADSRKALIFQLWTNSAVASVEQPAAALSAARPAEAPVAAACRDRFLWPFAATSIWNTPIGSLAIYVDAGIYSLVDPLRALPSEIHNDQDWLIRASPSDPLVMWIDDSGNFPGGCSATGKAAPQMLPIPPTLATDCVANNNGAGLLLPDNRTLVQMQPLYIPKAGGPVIAWYHTGAPQPFPWEIDILGDGALGAHGGSGLSSFGGAVRLGELLPGAAPIAHALKLELWAHAYYFYNWSSSEYASCFTWPAVGCDSYWDNTQGDGYNGTNPFLKPGALLAVPPARAAALLASLATAPARQIAQALVDFGGYLVDDTGSQRGGAAICMESGVNAEVEAAYGYSVRIENPLMAGGNGAALYADLVKVFQALSVVVNNGPASIGGGGTPRAPPPPPICA
jgi:hypothetical protein